MPTNNVDFWVAKFERNVARDISKVGTLSRLGWRIAVIWECAVRTDIESVVDQVAGWITSESHFLEIPEPQGIPSHHAGAAEAGANYRV